MNREKIALIIPPSNIEEQYGSLFKAAPVLPLLGIAFIAKYLSLQDIDTDIYDFSVDKKSTYLFFDKISDYKIIGMPAFITTLPDVISFAKIIKDKNPQCFTVVGGPHATLFPEDFFVNGIDIIIKGEGEIPFCEIVFKILGNSFNFSSIRGLHFRKNGKFFYTGDSNLMDDLDKIDSPLIEKFKLSCYYPPVHILGKKTIHTLTSRGCPYDCNFCAATKIFKGRIRFRSIDLVIEELKKYIAQGYDSVIFYDDIFTINRKRTIELCEKVISCRIKIKWTCFSRTDAVDKELLNYMKEAGCYLITFGCESGNNKTLELLNKKLTVEKNHKGIALTHEAGILAASSFMIGLPGEDRSDIERTVTFAKNSKLTFAYFPIFEPYKGTAIFDISEQKGKWINDSGLKNHIFNYQEKIWVPNGLTRNVIEKYARKAFKEFYLRYEIIDKITRTVALALPIQRKIRFILFGIDYFILKRFISVKGRIGSRF